MSRPFTGRHMTGILVAGFGVVITVNLVMARFAVSTFGGVVVENSYVASQHFNRWLDAAERERTLGWDPRVTRAKDDRVVVTFDSPLPPAGLKAVARHPLGRLPDTRLQFRAVRSGQFVSTAPLVVGRWILRFDASAGSKTWRGERPLS